MHKKLIHACTIEQIPLFRSGKAMSSAEQHTGSTLLTCSILFRHRRAFIVNGATLSHSATLALVTLASILGTLLEPPQKLLQLQLNGFHQAGSSQSHSWAICRGTAGQHLYLQRCARVNLQRQQSVRFRDDDVKTVVPVRDVRGFRSNTFGILIMLPSMMCFGRTNTKAATYRRRLSAFTVNGKRPFVYAPYVCSIVIFTVL